MKGNTGHREVKYISHSESYTGNKQVYGKKKNDQEKTLKHINKL